VYEDKPIIEIRQYRETALSKIWSQIKRLENPQTYYVDYSFKLYELKNALIEKFRK
jgi:nicotinate phosphoribosyltransferase